MKALLLIFSLFTMFGAGAIEKEMLSIEGEVLHTENTIIKGKAIQRFYIRRTFDYCKGCYQSPVMMIEHVHSAANKLIEYEAHEQYLFFVKKTPVFDTFKLIDAVKNPSLFESPRRMKRHYSFIVQDLVTTTLEQQLAKHVFIDQGRFQFTLIEVKGEIEIQFNHVRMNKYAFEVFRFYIEKNLAPFLEHWRFETLSIHFAAVILEGKLIVRRTQSSHREAPNHFL